MRTNLAWGAALCILAAAAVAASSESDAYKDYTVMEPSCEWRDIGPTEMVPGGLELSMNLETGVRRARLRGCAGESEAGGVGAVGVREAMEARATTGAVVVSENSGEPRNGDAPDVPSPEFHDRVAAMEALLDQMVKMEVEVGAKSLIARHTEQLAAYCARGEGDHDQTVALLSELEDLLHEREYAAELQSSAGGADGYAALAACIGGERVPQAVRAHAAWALGTAMQNNAQAQERFLARDVATLLESALGAEPAVQRKALYAIGAFARGNPDVQRSLLASGHLARWLASARAAPDDSALKKLETVLADIVDEGTDDVAHAVALLLSNGVSVGPRTE
eukprot:Amastigsp_a516395_10.p1 type:complete len:337 gc:universal Amastigsp_a516395_10:1026-16(-)